MIDMKLSTAVKPILCLALMCAFVPSAAQADAWNRKTVVTFSGPVEIPGVHAAGWGILPAGTYVFKILDSLSDRHIVQIFNKEETQIYATILAIPNYRLKATDKTVMTFAERAAGEPEALRAWFYPGRNWGEEFVYPKSRAIALAKATNTPVLYTPVDLPIEVSTPSPKAYEPVVVELKRAPIMAIEPSGQDVVIAQVVTTPPASELVADSQVSTPEPAARQVAETLPATASDLPLIALLGIMALVSGLTIRSIAKTF
jgi:hypothetical protein